MEVLSATEIHGANGQGATVIRTYQPPLDGKSDDYEGFDNRVAEGIGVLLNKHYFGYRWKSYSDAKQGIVGFSIPKLMGPTLHMVIRLAEFKDIEQIVVDKAGELLERMNLPRDRAGMAKHLEDEAQHRKHTFQFDDKRLQ